MPFKSIKDLGNSADAYGEQDDTDYDQDEIYAHGLLEGPGTSSSTGHISLQREGPPFCKSLPYSSQILPDCSVLSILSRGRMLFIHLVTLSVFCWSVTQLPVFFFLSTTLFKEC